MKKKFLYLVLVCCLSFSIHAQNTGKVVDQLFKSESVNKLSVGSCGMFFAKLAGGIDDIPFVKGAKSFDLVMVKDECSESQKKEFRKNLMSIKDDKEYATLVQVKDNKDHVRIMMRKDKDTIKELLFIVFEDNDDMVVMRLKGNMKESELNGLVEKYNRGDGC